MLIIVNSMAKCGSTWFHNFVTRCLSRLGEPTLKAAIAGRPVTLNERGNPGGGLSGCTLDALLAAAEAQTFAIKAHVPPNTELVAALEQQRARMIFLIRDPVDIVRSALAYGEFCRAADWDEPYRHMHTPQDAADFTAPMVEWAMKWLAEGFDGMVARYEDVFSGDEAVRSAAHRLEPLAAPVSAEVLDSMRPDRLSLEERQWLRVNLVRRPPLDAATLERCRRWAEKIGYSPPEQGTG